MTKKLLIFIAFLSFSPTLVARPSGTYHCGKLEFLDGQLEGVLRNTLRYGDMGVPEIQNADYHPESEYFILDFNQDPAKIRAGHGRGPIKSGSPVYLEKDLHPLGRFLPQIDPLLYVARGNQGLKQISHSLKTLRLELFPQLEFLEFNLYVIVRGSVAMVGQVVPLRTMDHYSFCLRKDGDLTEKQIGEAMKNLVIDFKRANQSQSQFTTDVFNIEADSLKYYDSLKLLNQLYGFSHNSNLVFKTTQGPYLAAGALLAGGGLLAASKALKVKFSAIALIPPQLIDEFVVRRQNKITLPEVNQRTLEMFVEIADSDDPESFAKAVADDDELYRELFKILIQINNQVYKNQI